MFFADFLYKWKLRRYQKDRESADKVYRKAMDEASEGKDMNKYEEARSEGSHFWMIHTDDLDLFITAELRKRAEQYFVTMPDRDDSTFWRDTYAGGYKALTKAGIVKVQDDIRAEQRKEIELRNLSYDSYIKLATALTGLGGIIAGIVVVWRK